MPSNSQYAGLVTSGLGALADYASEDENQNFGYLSQRNLRNQDEILRQLLANSQGLGHSQALEAAKMNAQATAANQRALAASAGPQNAAVAARMGAYNQAKALGSAQGQAAQAMAREQQAAQQLGMDALSQFGNLQVQAKNQMFRDRLQLGDQAGGLRDYTLAEERRRRDEEERRRLEEVASGSAPPRPRGQ